MLIFYSSLSLLPVFFPVFLSYPSLIIFRLFAPTQLSLLSPDLSLIYPLILIRFPCFVFVFLSLKEVLSCSPLRSSYLSPNSLTINLACTFSFSTSLSGFPPFLLSIALLFLISVESPAIFSPSNFFLPIILPFPRLLPFSLFLPPTSARSLSSIFRYQKRSEFHLPDFWIFPSLLFSIWFVACLSHPLSLPNIWMLSTFLSLSLAPLRSLSSIEISSFSAISYSYLLLPPWSHSLAL